MPDEPTLTSEVKSEFFFRVKWIAAAILDGVFLLLWVAIQLLVNRYLNRMELLGPDRYVVFAFQWLLFPVSTVAPIAIWIYKDIRIMVVRAQREIDREKN